MSKAGMGQAPLQRFLSDRAERLAGVEGIAVAALREDSKYWQLSMIEAVIANGAEFATYLQSTWWHFANEIKLREMLAAGNFCVTDGRIDARHFSVLDAYRNTASVPKLFWPNVPWHLEILTARAMLGENSATTAQFLQYLIDNQQAGIDFPIVHATSVRVGPDGGWLCLCVSRYDAGRSLNLRSIEDNFGGPWRFFGTQSC